jgi:NTE family protein
MNLETRTSLMREMRAISFVTRLIDDGKVEMDRLKRLHIHAISAEARMRDFGVLSKFNADWDFLLDLKEVGRAHADAWLQENFDQIGRRSTIDINAAYL